MTIAEAMSKGEEVELAICGLAAAIEAVIHRIVFDSKEKKPLDGPLRASIKQQMIFRAIAEETVKSCIIMTIETED